MLPSYRNLLINKTANVKDAMTQLDKTAAKILFVVDEQEKLIGSLSDGDIRRWILNEGSLYAMVKEVCFKDTYYVRENFNMDDVNSELRKRKISYVPVLALNNRIDGIISVEDLTGELKVSKSEKLDVHVAIMAGGKGTRLDPFTRILPKPLIPIGDQTILELIISKFLPYNVNEFYISVNHKSSIIKSYFEDISPSYTIVYLDEEKPLGTIGALKQLEGVVSKELILTNCDILIDIKLEDLLRHHRAEKNDVTLVTSLKEFKIPYGICKIEDGGKLISLSEKPRYNYLVNTGMYVLNPHILSYIPENQFFHATDLIDLLQSEKAKIGVFPISEASWIDIGEWTEYKKALESIKI